MILAPIVLFAYKRLDTLTQTVESLKLNYLAPQSELIIFSDNAKSESDRLAVSEVRNYIEAIKGFRSVTVHKAEKNKGLARSIIEGVTHIFLNYDKAIVLEDDLVTSPNFLNFMNEGLEFYKTDNKVFSISGFTTPVNFDQNYEYDAYFTNRSYSWGWGTWKDRWNNIDWNINSSILKNTSNKKLIQKSGPDLIKMLEYKAAGKIDSWAVVWCVNQAIQGSFTVFPIRSKVINIGFVTEATHTSQRFNRFSTTMDDQIQKTSFKFNSKPFVEKYIDRQFFKPFSFSKRLVYKLMNLVLN